MKNIFTLLLFSLIAQTIVFTQTIIHNNTSTLVTGIWNSNGTLTNVTTNSPCEGSSHYQFTYSAIDWWAGFGFNMNNWAATPGIKYNFSTFQSLRITYKGLTAGHQLNVRLRNNYSLPENSNNVLIGTTSTSCNTVDIPISSFVSGSTFDLTSVTELVLFIGNTQTGSGTVFVDNIQLIPASPTCNLVVSSTQNAGNGSLRDALACAQENNVITFASGLMGQTIQLDNTPITVSKNIKIHNQGGGDVTIVSTNGSTMFNVDQNKELSIENVNLIGNGKRVFNNLGVVRLKDVDIDMKNDTSFQNQGQVIIEGNVNVKWLPFQNVPEVLSDYIVVDQFGYRNSAKKVAIIRSPIIGYDAGQSFSPGNQYALVNQTTQQQVFTANIIAWNNGTTDAASGDRVWWFDFSQVTTPGTYYVLDVNNGSRSFNFKIGNDVYKDVLKAAFKTFYYQRAGFNKTSQFAGAAWVDGPSHLQDTVSRAFLDQNNVSKIKNLSGGWYDAGDYNKYTAWHASYIVTLLQMYRENPTVWTDDYGIPESGNGIPDILDEVLFGLQWLYKMQQSNGSSLSVLGVASASPPSASSGSSYYGLASTFATLRTSEAFAYAAYVFNTVPSLSSHVTNLRTRAEQAWTWANANPNVLFPNNQGSNNKVGLAAGNQETNDLGRSTAKLGAALYLYLATNTVSYKTYFEANYNQMPLILWNNYVSQYFFEQQDILLEYCLLPNANASIVSAIKNATNAAMKNAGDFANIVLNNASAYRAFIKDYNWGSNQYKSIYGNFFNLVELHNIDASNNLIYKQAAESYLHYIHGANPFNRTYLTNLSSLGADKQITQFYNSWFADQSAWDTNPAPGFLAGGPNSSYNYDSCCPTGCGGASNNAKCTSESTTPPKNQPPMKSYKDFNTSWPLNSWEVTENSNGYQVAYLRLLAKFVE